MLIKFRDQLKRDRPKGNTTQEVTHSHKMVGKLSDATLFKTALQDYFYTANGTRKDFSDVQHLFDAVYHDKFTLVHQDGTVVHRDAAKDLHANYFSTGTNFSIVRFKKIGLNYVKFGFQIMTEDKFQVFNLVCSVEDNKLAKVWVVDSFGSMLGSCCVPVVKTMIDGIPHPVQNFLRTQR
ncbi:hypothetical protein ACHAWF_005980 [Thalassiosira exigua]